MFTEPLGGWRHTVAMKTRKKEDFALLMRKVRAYPTIEKCGKITGVMKNDRETSV
jgi:hypothetical protein